MKRRWKTAKPESFSDFAGPAHQKLLRPYLNTRCGRVSRLIERTRLKLKSRIPQIRHTPGAAIRRRRIRTPQDTVNAKFDTRDTNVVTCRRGDRYGRSAYDDGVVSRARD